MMSLANAMIFYLARSFALVCEMLAPRLRVSLVQKSPQAIVRMGQQNV
jgi:hypothetical protein